MRTFLNYLMASILMAGLAGCAWLLSVAPWSTLNFRDAFIWMIGFSLCFESAKTMVNDAYEKHVSK